MKLARMLSAIGVLAALAGCKTCWIDRDDDRPMKYGSVRDCLDYGWWGECFHPKYHCGAPDGIRDHVSVKKAAVKAANRALSEQNCGETSRDFRYGFQQAYIDIANGGSGTLPAVPPPRYWAAPYRTTWGHNKAREWFSGYEAGVSSAKCCMPTNTISVPTSVYRGYDHRLAVGLDGRSFGAAPIVNTNYGWSGGEAAAYSQSPMMGSPYSSSPMPYSPSPYSMPPSGGAIPAPSMIGPMPFGVSPGARIAPPIMPPAMTTPSSEGVPGGGHSIPVPQNELVNPPAPMTGQSFAPPAPQQGGSANNPWSQSRGLNGFGFKPEGALR